ncbi:MAG: hypothetical protein HOM21_03905, partial [Halobacteriovoraceae bacterium]|nr:hypothetical protein [Halobacteriovoraceae bacterium]
MQLFLIISFLLFSGGISAKTVKLNSLNPARKAAKLFLPRAYKKQEKWPLIISMHGYGGSGALQKFYIRLKHFQNQRGFMLLIPNGLEDPKGKGHWNASEYCCDFWKKGVDDVGYIKSLIDRIRNDPKLGRLDEDRIFVLGYSNGGFMAKKIACGNEIKVAGIVSISGTSDLRDASGELIAPEQNFCQHQRAIPILHIHGTEDQTIKYGGFDNQKTGHLGALEYLKRWGQQNQCRGGMLKSRKKVNATNFRKGKETEHFVMQECLAPV